MRFEALTSGWFFDEMLVVTTTGQQGYHGWHTVERAVLIFAPNESLTVTTVQADWQGVTFGDWRAVHGVLWNLSLCATPQNVLMAVDPRSSLNGGDVTTLSASVSGGRHPSGAPWYEQAIVEDTYACKPPTPLCARLGAISAVDFLNNQAEVRWAQLGEPAVSPPVRLSILEVLRPEGQYIIWEAAHPELLGLYSQSIADVARLRPFCISHVVHIT